MQLTKDFHSIEFACKDGTLVPEPLMPNVLLLANNLQIIRDEIECPLHINSGYRTESHNKKIGGEPNSFHKKAMAADLTCTKYTPSQLREIILRLIREGKIKQGGVGSYKTFTHYDIRGTAARWKG